MPEKKEEKGKSGPIPAHIDGFLVFDVFKTAKDAVIYIQRFFKAHHMNLKRDGYYFLVKLFKKALERLEPDLKQKFSILVFIESILPGLEDDPVIEGPSFDDFENEFNFYASIQNGAFSDDDLEHFAKSYFDPEYRERVWGLSRTPCAFQERIMGNFISRLLLPACERETSKTAILQKLKRFQSLGIRYKIYQSESSDTEGWYAFGASQFFLWFFKEFSFPPGNLSKEDQELLLILSHFLPDPIRARRLQSLVIEKSIGTESFDKELSRLFENPDTRSLGDISVKDRWVEERNHTPEELEKMRLQILKNLEGLSGDEEVLKFFGKLGVTDILEGSINFKLELLETLLEVQESDERLKSLLVKYSSADFLVREEVFVANDIFIDSIFGLNDEARYALLRLLLMGKDGIFRTKAHRQKFLKNFLARMVKQDEEERDILNLFNELIPVLAAVEDPELFYFSFFPLLFRRFAHPPKKRVPWKDILGDNFKEDNMPVIRNEILAVHEVLDEKFFRGKENGVQDEKLSPLALVLEIAKSLGAPGVRFLQLMGQYLAVPENYEQSFLEIYDQIRGQSKLAAHHVLRREWKDFRETIKTLKPRCGGGSLMTVYEAEMHNGEREVIKVLNPNVKYHLETVFGFLSKILEALVKRYGSKYEPALTALADIREWIKRDIDTTGFLDDDRKFHETYHGWKPQAGSFRYQIGIPKTKPPENPYFIREEYVDGDNLTKWNELAAQGHDMKEIIALLCQNYVAQVLQGQAHADFHIGNIRIGKDKTCYLLDRGGFYLKFDEEDQKLFFSLFSGDVAAFQEAAAIYFIRMNPAVTAAHMKVMAASFDPDTPQDWLFRLKQTGIKVPLKITLLMKNFGVLEVLSKKAGFGNLKEAFTYSPKTE
jgi:hypothetical protein